MLKIKNFRNPLKKVVMLDVPDGRIWQYLYQEILNHTGFQTL